MGSTPGLMWSEGLPISVQVVGRAYEERLVLAVAGGDLARTRRLSTAADCGVVRQRYR